MLETERCETAIEGPLNPELLAKMDAYTPFDMCVLNNIDRFQLTVDAIHRVSRLAPQLGAAQQWYSEQIQRHKLYVSENGEDLPEVRNWRWRER